MTVRIVSARISPVIPSGARDPFEGRNPGIEPGRRGKGSLVAALLGTTDVRAATLGCPGVFRGREHEHFRLFLVSPS
jgi:hypothetical protein